MCARQAEDIVQRLNADGSDSALVFAAELSAHIPTMNTIVSAARRQFKGEKVPNEEKVFSLFEPHTELIKKGKKDKPMELGHLIFLTQTREKFITDCILFSSVANRYGLSCSDVGTHQATHRVGHVPGLKIAKTAQNQKSSNADNTQEQDKTTNMMLRSQKISKMSIECPF